MHNYKPVKAVYSVYSAVYSAVCKLYEFAYGRFRK